MIAIADSGSTKTLWLILDNNGKEVERLEMQGMNPYHTTAGQMEVMMRDAFRGVDIARVEKVMFYGSGCSGGERNAEVEKGIRPFFPKAEIMIDSDIAGAAKALFQEGSGIAVILGTGSNTVIYENGRVTKGIRSTGYILGDEGSGAVIGKRILQMYFRNEMPGVIKESFEKRYKPVHSKLLENIYKKPFPNRYLASFAEFAGDNLANPVIKEMLVDVFDEYFRYQLIPLTGKTSLPVGVVGSVGWFFREVFKQKAEEYGYKVIRFLRTPVEGLRG
jgi:N-acetylglucosamine kinase-like BadF-type ATPase